MRDLSLRKARIIVPTSVHSTSRDKGFLQNIFFEYLTNELKEFYIFNFSFLFFFFFFFFSRYKEIQNKSFHWIREIWLREIQIYSTVKYTAWKGNEKITNKLGRDTGEFFYSYILSTSLLEKNLFKKREKLQTNS